MEVNLQNTKLKGYITDKVFNVKRCSLTALFILSGILSGISQELQPDSLGTDFFLRKERYARIIAHTNGFGLGYTLGKSTSVFNKQVFNVDFVTMKSAKEVRQLYEYGENSKSYIYGKLGHLFILRASVGQERLLNRKPYWGGVEVRYFYHAGGSLGLLKPIYLYIINYTTTKPVQAYLTNERYDPTKHFQENIYGRSEFSYGIKSISVYPGLFGRVGFTFEYGSENEKIKALEFGVCGDFFPKGIKMMAFNDPYHYFITFYLSFNFGNRHNRNTESEQTD